MPNETFGGGPGPEWAVGLGLSGGQAPAAVPSLLQMAQGVPPSLPTNDTPEGIEAAQQYARQLQYANDNPHMRISDHNTANIIAGFGGDYVRSNNITYEPVGTGGGSGFYMDSLADKVAGRAKSIPIPEVQGDAGRQLNRLPQHLRDAYGPAVVQHIMSSGSPGYAYPGSVGYAPLPKADIEPGDMFRASRDAWGRAFGSGGAGLPWPTRPQP